MKATRLPSGNWRVMSYLGKGKDGKPIRKSVTAPTKSEALRKAALLKPPEYDDTMTVQEACEEYLRIRGPELSPATVRGYKTTFETQIKGSALAYMRLGKLKTPAVQAWISEMEGTQKTKRNHLGFLTAAIRFFDEERIFRVKIADTEPKGLYTPTVQEVDAVLSFLDEETLKAALLGIFGLRRGEACALDGEDIDRASCLVRISKDVVKDPSGTWIRKAPKTKKSVRWVPVPKEVIDLLPASGPVISVSPDQITNRFARAVRKAEVPHFRLHDLRSFFASVSIGTLGVAEKSVQELGGWKTSHVLKKHYERTMSDQLQRDTETILTFFKSHISVLNEG